MSPPLVSVIIPSFNRLALLLEAVDSVLAQRVEGSAEVLVIDDASDDGTQTAVEERYGGEHTVRYLRHAANRGVSAARNTGIDAARGRFLAFLDSDDVVLPGRLESQLARFAASPNLVAVGGAIAVSGPDLRVTHTIGYPEQDLDIRWRGLFAPMLCLSATMVDGPALRAACVRFDESIPIAEDFDFLSALLVHGPAANLPRPLIKLRKHAGNSAIRSFDAYRRTLLRCALRNVAAVGMPMEPDDLQGIHTFLNNGEPVKAGISRRRWTALYARTRALLDAVRRHSLPAPERCAALAAILDDRLRLVPDDA
ncbi:glycosyltransferase family 2 protein [Azospirillum soli]|uniref:glycosyltransferase family 2 protein n=1 Tax=Azospirillum soli TaxID=1304799 RepID=UPI001AE1257A|nr:glycosyltransferase family 2 protein [Azospirillum soli]MBP2316544.1 glycosyltransferase involved in cell wall biosynthesis [Azospirillum soli]